MPSHYSDIGFFVEKVEDIADLINRFYEKGNNVIAKHGDYRLIIIDDFIEFWVQIKRNKLIGLEFHYSSDNFIKIKFGGYIKNKKNSKMSGAIQINSNLCPIIVDVPNLDLYRNLKDGDILHMQIAAFAEELFIFNNKEEFYAAQEEEDIKYSTEFFIPTGMFNTDKKNPPEGYAMFSGIIKSFERRVNSISSKEYYYFTVECQGLTFDILADKDFITKEPVVGGFLKGSFWMSGKILCN